MDSHSIVAVCTAPGSSGIAVVRVSGADAYAVADAFCARSTLRPSRMSAGTFKYVKLTNPFDGTLIDEAVVLAFRAPHSYTGEDVIEFQTHGGRIATQRTLEGLIACGAMPAEPGEFSRRAFLNGRMDLSMAEAVMDIIGAQSERAGRVAAEQLGGALGQRINTCYDELMNVCADIEASLDFADDESNDVLVPADIPQRLSSVIEDLTRLSNTWREGVLLREGARVVLSGSPNAGKSTLFNALLGILRAIVTDIPGTTRDSIEEILLLEGIPLRIIDTAGIRTTDSTVEQMGIERARELVDVADLNLRLVDMSILPGKQLDWMQEDDADPNKTIVVLSKIDKLSCGSNLTVLQRVVEAGYEAVMVSAHDGTGMDDLKAAMMRKVLNEGQPSDSQDVVVSERHHALIQKALADVQSARNFYVDGGGDTAVFCAQALRAAAEFLAEITGRIYSDDLLDRVFSRFCVGK